ncbi:Similar to S.cerevisiae protein PKC1 (Protein serine/threonine kinase) [Malassezia sympodialis ATCC 42132]|uniref:protein kinase C n=1 Tax=Malassezia sympodialis (strain ATCC 42132) TaxID=1230383 RepID=A0A1M8A4I3_MALS4|nr:Similar to S.cerevisiae protein PKC1 (Protein serine/threonine kinase) [Malassezia sympodialis ATCC 42132]
MGKIADLESRIAKQRRIIEGFQSLCHATPNQDVIRQAESNIRSAQHTISFLEESLAQLQRRGSLSETVSAGPDGISVPVSRKSTGSISEASLVAAQPSPIRAAHAAPSFPIDSSAAYRNQELNGVQDTARRVYTALDLLRYDTPLTNAKVQRKLDQLQYKLQLERQYKLGYDKIAQLYQAEGDRRIQDDAKHQRMETASKMVLIQQALSRYQHLYIQDGQEIENPYVNRRPRKPQPGTLRIAIEAARDVDHAPMPSGQRLARESYVAVKIEEQDRVHTHASRSDTWGERFELPMEDTSEVELILFDRVGTTAPVPVGLVWLRVSDIADHLRKIKFGQVGADGAGPSPAMEAPNMPDTAAPGTNAAADQGVEGWFTVEPTGALYLRLNYVKQNGPKRPVEQGLGRQGAVRMRPKEVSEVNGHRFVARQFYQMIRCAFCGELLLNASGAQCEDCLYTCHRKCAQKVVIRCVSRSGTGADNDDVNLKHRIPHRFEPFSNLGANWCCHCGSMLSLGRRSNRKCSECDVTCHADCAHLVPDFCGMSMETANQMMSNIATIKKNRLSIKPQQPPPGAPRTPAMEAGRPSVDALSGGMQGLNVSSRPAWASSGSSPVGSVPTTPTAPRSPQPSTVPAPVTPSAKRPVPEAAGLSPASAGRLAPGPAPVAPTSASTSPQKARTGAVQELPPSSDRKVALDDFNFLAVLGKGNFGKVMLAEEKHTGQLFAIKVLKKEFIIENDEIDSTRSEKRVFLTAAREQHPFLLSLHSCFQTETRVYFVMEYVSGGDLMLHIQREQFNLHRAKFYAAEVLLALEYFHKHGIIYRDLKLDNIMLTLDGHIKIADYGLCKEGMWYGNTTSTFCGTPEFMAPEILLEQRYGRAVDWWAFGILLYEMLLGQAPFRGDDEDEIFDAILEDEPLYPIQMPRDSVSLLQRLLTRDPTRRLGAGPNDAEEVKAHPFFRDINWDDLLRKRVPPPFLPTLKNASDTTWFDTEFTNEKPMLTPVHSVFSPQDQAEFRDFSWTNPHIM